VDAGMGLKIRNCFYRVGIIASILLSLSSCSSDAADHVQVTHDNVRFACTDGGETVTDGYYERVSSSSALYFKFDLLYNNCTSVSDFTDTRTKKSCLLTTTYDGPLTYSYSYFPSGESYDFELSLESPEPLTFSINDKKYKIQFNNFKSIGNETRKTYSGTIIVDGVEYAADDLIQLIETSMIFCP